MTLTSILFSFVPRTPASHALHKGQDELQLELVEVNRHYELANMTEKSQFKTKKSFLTQKVYEN